MEADEGFFIVSAIFRSLQREMKEAFIYFRNSLWVQGPIIIAKQNDGKLVTRSGEQIKLPMREFYCILK